MSESASLVATKSASSAAKHNREMARLRKELDHLALTTQALWEITRDKCELTDAELLEKMKEVDARDGTVDGRITPKG